MSIRYLVVGKGGQLANEFIDTLTKKREDFLALSYDELDITNLDLVLEYVQAYKPLYIINCAAYNNVDLAEKDFDIAYEVNAVGTYNLVYASKKFGSFFIHYSSDYVFDGNNRIPYIEEDIVSPINEYGKSKFLSEKLIQRLTKDYLIFRLSWVFGDGTQNFIYKLKTWTKKNSILNISFDEVSVPTHTKTIVEVTLLAIEKNIRGLYHLTNSGYCSRFDWAKLILKEMNLETKIKIIPVSKDSFNLAAKRPSFSVMNNNKISKTLNINILSWQDAIKEYFTDK